jgi:hypothetical protein
MKTAMLGDGILRNQGSRVESLNRSGGSAERRKFAILRMAALYRAAATPRFMERAGVKAGVCLIWLLVFSATLVQAQYSMRRHSFSTVGSKSTGGSYSVSSAIGTTGAGATASGGGYSVTPSPWSVAVVETPGAPKLGIAAAGAAVKVTWPSPSTGWLLQQNTNSVSSVNWSNVTATIQDDGTTKVLIVNPPTGNRFYRLFKPD